MPYLRASKDRRGYEHVFLLHQDPRRGGPRASLIYWHRSPPNVRVGRPPLDPDTVARLDAAHPEVVFDWPKLRQSLASSRAAGSAAREDEGGGRS